MVLWEITLATAYFLGLRRTYRLALKIQRRLISHKHPKIRQFAHRYCYYSVAFFTIILMLLLCWLLYVLCCGVSWGKKRMKLQNVVGDHISLAHETSKPYYECSVCSYLLMRHVFFGLYKTPNHCIRFFPDKIQVIDLIYGLLSRLTCLPSVLVFISC